MVFPAEYGIKLLVPYIFSQEFLDLLNTFPASIEHCPTEPGTLHCYCSKKHNHAL